MEQYKDLGSLVNKDLSPLKNEFLYESENFTIVSDEGSTYKVRTNVKGNTGVVDIPNLTTKTTFKILNDLSILNPFSTYYFTFDVDGTSYEIPIGLISGSITTSNKTEVIIKAISLALTGFGITNSYYLYGNNSYLSIECSSLYLTTVESLATFPPVPPPTRVDITSSFSVEIKTTPGQYDLKIIGWTTIRNDIYLLTTNGTFNPDDDSTAPFTSYGQWWKLTYDPTSTLTDPINYNLTLIYNDLLNLTIYRPIANPGMIESRYENTNIQKIYWTDNYNVPRQINVADPLVNLLSAEDLNLQPSLSMDLPYVSKIVDGGSLKVGLHQFIYRLKNKNGSESRFSRASRLIPIIDVSESEGSSKYFPTKAVEEDANKSVILKVDNLDTTYDTIEIAHIYYKDNITVPEINLVKEDFIPSSRSIELLISGTPTTDVPITIDEATAFTIGFKKVKTLIAKRQTLFFGNVTTADQNIDFDARAFRFPLNSDHTDIEDSQGKVYSIDSTTWQIDTIDSLSVSPFDIPVEHDCIQDYDSQSPDDSTNNLYLPNSDILGGQGKYVKYEFVTEEVLLDNKYDTATRTYGPHKTPNENITISLDTTDRQYTAEGGSLSNYASPYLYDLIVGYRRDEMERFGIVFYDEFDNPTYTCWIGDIRLPHVFMPGDTAGANYASDRSTISNSEFESQIATYDNTSHKLRGNIVGVKFTIDFSSVPSKYKKASIVRVPKSDVDKHIVGQGLFMPTYKGFGLVTTNEVFTANPALKSLDPDNSDNSGVWHDCWTLRSPEFLFDDFKGSTTTDLVDVLGLYKSVESHYLATRQQTVPTIQDFTVSNYAKGDGRFYAHYYKNYSLEESNTIPNCIKDATSNNPYTVKTARNINQEFSDKNYNSGGVNINGGLPQRTLRNCGPKDTAGSGGGLGVNETGYSHNGKCLFIQLNETQSKDWADHTTAGYKSWYSEDGYPGASDTQVHNYVANYKKVPVAAFGGNTYFARGNNEYVSCNNLIDISDKANPIVTKVFGGDTIITVMDYTPQFFDIHEGSNMAPSTCSMMLHMAYFPVETSIAVDLRRNYNNGTASVSPSNEVTNRVSYLRIIGDTNDSGWTDGSHAIDVREYFNVDPVFNYTNKGIYRYFAKPALIDPIQEYDSRIWKSERKVDGELIESWSIFKPESFIDVESVYGPINNLLIFKDRLFFFQNKAYGLVSTGEQKLVQDTESSNLVMGEAGILSRYDYISTKYGCSHQFGMGVSENSVIWFDALSKKVVRMKGDGLEQTSDIKGYSSYIHRNTLSDILISDNPYLGVGVTTTYDYRRNQFYITFLNPRANRDSLPSFTLVYSEMDDGFVGSVSHTPNFYINDKSNIFSANYADNSLPYDLYINGYGNYGEFFGTTYPSKISAIINENPLTEKVLTNLEVQSEVYSQNTTTPVGEYNDRSKLEYNKFFDLIRVYNTYQNTDYKDLSVLSRKHKTLWNVKIPTDMIKDVSDNIFDSANILPTRPKFTIRLKDKWFIVDLIFNNTNNEKIVASSLKGIYSINSR